MFNTVFLAIFVIYFLLLHHPSFTVLCPRNSDKTANSDLNCLVYRLCPTNKQGYAVLYENTQN